MPEIKKLQQQLRLVLNPLGLAYGKVMGVRRSAYQQGVISSFRPITPTVAVGNISWGGTGKTPVVNWILGWAEKKGLHAVVLTRGYKAEPKTLPFVVTADSDPKEAGDEPLMLAKANSWATVIIDPKRRRAAAFAEDQLAPDLFVMDDGFQHLALKRDLNIVLLTQEDISSGWNRVMPAGTWREGVEALGDADVFLLRLDSGVCDDEAKVQLVVAEASKRLGSALIFPFYIQNKSLRDISGGGVTSTLEGRPYNLVCGVGSPESVLTGAKSLVGYGPSEFFTYSDHHIYTQEDVGRICGSGIELVCTEKDAVKLEKFLPNLPCRVWALQLDLNFLPISSNSFEKWWEESMASLSGKVKP